MNGQDTLARLRAAVAEDLIALAVLHDRELDHERITALRAMGDALLGFPPRGEAGRLALALFRSGLADIPVGLDKQTLDVLAVEYADIYLNHSLAASPYESVWIDEDGLAMQGPMFAVRAWYHQYALAAANWRVRADDHLVHQLGFIAHLVGGREDGLEDAALFMDEHLLRWIDRFAERVAGRCRTRFYAGLAGLTAAYLHELREVLVIVAGLPIPSTEEIDTRMRQPMALPEGAVRYVPGREASW